MIRTSFSIIKSYIIGYLSGFIFSLLIGIIMAYTGWYSSVPGWSDEVVNAVSLFIAGFIVGYLASNKGWLISVGLGLILALRIIFGYYLFDSKTTFINLLLAVLVIIIFTTAGGYFGQFFKSYRSQKRASNREVA